MWSSLRVAATSMQAQQRALDVTANNLSNLQTVGFKAFRANIVDLPPEDLVFGVPDETGAIMLQRREISPGVAIGGMLADLEQGPLTRTFQPLDVAIEGDGYLALSLADGRTAYTRDGSLHIDSFGRLVGRSGAVVQPALTVPANTSDVTVDADGTVIATMADGERQTVGQLMLTRFVNPEGLEHIGSNMLVATPAAGEMTVAVPGQDGLGILVPGALEGSNVDVSEEYVKLMHAQRAYQISARALRTMDEMLQGANNMRR